MRAVLLYTVSVLFLELTSGIHGRVANFPKQFGEFPRMLYYVVQSLHAVHKFKLNILNGRKQQQQ